MSGDERPLGNGSWTGQNWKATMGQKTAISMPGCSTFGLCKVAQRWWKFTPLGGVEPRNVFLEHKRRVVCAPPLPPVMTSAEGRMRQVCSIQFWLDLVNVLAACVGGVIWGEENRELRKFEEIVTIFFPFHPFLFTVSSSDYGWRVLRERINGCKILEFFVLSWLSIYRFVEVVKQLNFIIKIIFNFHDLKRHQPILLNNSCYFRNGDGYSFVKIFWNFNELKKIDYYFRDFTISQKAFSWFKIFF